MKKLFLIILIIIGFIPLLGLFHSGLPITHDGKDHVARIANFYQNLQEGNLIPRWAGNLNWGYGHPILEFLYPLPSYIASVSHLIGFSFIDSAKIVFGIGMLASAVGMYLWLGEFLPIPAAFIGGVIYLFTPYRFVEVYVRGDIGENLAFVFMPLTLLFIYRLYKKGKDSGPARMTICLTAISFASLMLSHNAIVLMYFPFIIFYCLYLSYMSKDKFYMLRTTCYSLLLGFALSAFFWVPALLEGKYTLRNIVTAGEYTSRYVSFPQLLYGPWSFGGTGQFSVQLGIINWIVLFTSVCIVFILWKKKDKNFLLTISLLLYTMAAIFLMLPLSQGIWQKIMLLQNFQFPWRFLAIPLFTTSVLGAIIVSLIPKPFYKFVIFLLLLLILFFNKDYWHAKGYLYHSDQFFSAVYNSTTDTGESSPIWSVRFMEKQPKKHVEVIAGKAMVTPLQRNMTKHVYAVTAITEAGLRENTIYFPGWEVLQDGKEIPIQYQDPHNRGIITFSVAKGRHMITVVYTETKLRLVADVISLLSLLSVVIVLSVTYVTKNPLLRYNKENQ
ncbi:MAG TPA: 6-pyruvoyl-tetrahydropterin synthase-related protein [Candidatus Saccharimonadales bacterium]|nr:6-pyruvoyl-tetrahydropterin synthase-related protein [Candidatus Saccharimonadales bacterium]